jgi:hypothetical protein
VISRLLTQELWNPADYLEAVRQVVKSLESDGHNSLLEVCRRSRGAFPTLVAQFSKVQNADAYGYHDSRRPYPSPARGEWYFTRETAEILASRLGNSPLLIGTPSLAEITVNATLIDSSPWIGERFGLSTTNHVINRPVEQLELLPTSDTAIIDPPWYGGATEDWLTRASSVVKPGGSILVPLMGELTRPTAAADRAAVIAAMRNIGTVTVLQGVVEYATPLFEECAMAAAGIRLGGPWRIADLAIVINEIPAKRPERTRTASVSEWTDYRVGDDIISLRCREGRDDRSDISLAYYRSRIGEVLTLDSVSRRHPLLTAVNLWSSRSRVACVDDVRAVQRALTLLDSPNSIDIETPDSTLAIRLRRALMEEVECSF